VRHPIQEPVPPAQFVLFLALTLDYRNKGATWPTSVTIMFTKVALYLFLCFIAIGAILVWLADPLYLKAPKDRELFTVFQDHRAAFEQLRQMATEDSVSYFSESHLDTRLSDTRRQKYKSLLSEIRHGLTVTTNKQSVRFIFASGGLFAIGPGWLKGIEYLPGSADREGAIAENLDHLASLATGGVYLRQIEPNWFVIVQKTD